MIGLLPAAGKAERIHGLPKFLLPTQNSYLLERHVNAMLTVCNDVLIGSNPDNYGLLCEYAPLKAHIYRPRQYATMTETVLGALDPDYKEERFLFGMPDTYWADGGVYRKLARVLELFTNAVVTVAVFKARPGQHRTGGMARIGRLAHVTEVIDKPETTDLEYIWGAMAWKPAFWQYMQPDDPHIGYALARGVAMGMDARAVICEGEFWDCGTPEGYFEMIRATTGEGIHV